MFRKKSLTVDIFKLFVFSPLLIILAFTGVISWWIVALFVLSEIEIKFTFNLK